jgi:pimeloyl-ACP methyl ester carboxylesterase
MKLRVTLGLVVSLVLLGPVAYAQQPAAMNLDTVTKTVTVNGLSFPVVDHGSGPPVLLLHGFPDNRHMWRYQVGPLADAGYRVIAPDLRGFGDAPRPQDPKEYSRAHLMGDVLGILDALGVKGPVQLVAHDHGAGLGWRLMADHGDRFDRYVTLSIGAPGGTTTIEQREKSWYTALFRQAGVAEDELKKDNWKLFREWARHPEAERWVKELSRPGALTSGLNWYRAPAAPPNPPIVTKPVLAIWSDGDAYLTEPRVKSSGERIAGPFRYEKITGASHWMMLDKPAETNRLLLSFLTKTPNARPAPFDIEAHTKKVQANGMTFPVVDYGTGAPVLLLHGFPDSRHLWRYQIGPLAAAGFRVIAPDLRGFGDAPRPQDAKEYARPLLMADVLGILDALGLKQVQMVAHDHGAGLAWRLAAEHPARFERYVALSVGAPGGTTPIEQREKSWYGALFRQAGFAEEELQRDNWRLFRDWARNPVEIDRYIKDLSRPGALTSGLNWYRAPAAPEAPPVTIPVLGIWSDGDAYLTEHRVKTTGERIKAPFRYEKISGASHWMMVDKPEELNKLLLGFLTTQTKGESR